MDGCSSSSSSSHGTPSTAPTSQDCVSYQDDERSESPGFLFVSCDGRNGRPTDRARPLLNRHVMLRYVSTHINEKTKAGFTHSDPSSSQQTSVSPKGLRQGQTHPYPHQGVRHKEFQRPNQVAPKRRAARKESRSSPAASFSSDVSDAKPAAKNQVTRRSESSAAQSPAEVILDPGQLALIPTPSTRLASLDNGAEEGLCSWWFDYRNRSAGPLFEAAQATWVRFPWKMAQESPIFHNCIVMFNRRDKCDLTGNYKEYFSQKSSLIQKVQKDISARGVHLPLMTLLSIGMLAYSSVLDANLEVALTHLRGLDSANAATRFENTTIEWVFIMWIDLRLAMLLARSPVLAYMIPTAYRDARFPEMDSHAEAYQLASQCADQCPQSIVLGPTEYLDFFLKLFQLNLNWAELHMNKDPPYAILYDLEYRLCTLHQETMIVMKSNPKERTGALLVAALQVHVWVVSRFWTPCSQRTRQAYLIRVCRHLQPLTSKKFVTMWASWADLRSCLWALATISACALEDHLDRDLVPLASFRLVLSRCNIVSRADFMDEMKKWPWLESWHAAKFDLLWNELHPYDSPVDTTSLASTSSSMIKIRAPVFLGAVEFYNG